jgi:hypothetical protein
MGPAPPTTHSVARSAMSRGGLAAIRPAARDGCHANRSTSSGQYTSHHVLLRKWLSQNTVGHRSWRLRLPHRSATTAGHRPMSGQDRAGAECKTDGFRCDSVAKVQGHCTVSGSPSNCAPARRGAGRARPGAPSFGRLTQTRGLRTAPPSLPAARAPSRRGYVTSRAEVARGARMCRPFAALLRNECFLIIVQGTWRLFVQCFT